MLNRTKKKPILSTYIYDTLRQSVLTGQYLVGGQIPSEMNLSQQFNASRMTVRSSLKRLAKEGMIQPQPGKGWIVVAKEPQPTSTKAGPVLLVSTPNPDGMYCLEAARIFLEKKGLDSHICMQDQDGKWLGKVDWNAISGGIFYSGTPIPSNIFQESRDAGVPLVCAALGQQEDYDTVCGDHLAGTTDMLERLIKEGTPRIGYVSNGYLEGCPDPSFRLRRTAYEQVMRKHGLEPQVFLTEHNYPHGPEDGRNFSAWIKRLDQKGQRPQCLFGTVNAMVAFILFQMQSMGLSAKSDIRVTGACNNFEEEYLRPHGLTSLWLQITPLDTLGQLAAHRMYSRLNGDDSPPHSSLVKNKFVEWPVRPVV